MDTARNPAAFAPTIISRTRNASGDCAVAVGAWREQILACFESACDEVNAIARQRQSDEDQINSVFASSATSAVNAR